MKACPMKLGIFALSVAAASANTLFFSEYIESTSYRKALEIYNPTGSDVDGSTVTLQFHANGNDKSGSSSYSEDLAGHTLSAGATFTVCRGGSTGTTFEDDNVAACDVFMSGMRMQFNGNDKIELKVDGATVDVLGDDSGEYFGANKGLRRISTVQTGSTAYDASQWETFDDEDLAGLGSHIGSAAAAPAYVSLWADGTTRQCHERTLEECTVACTVSNGACTSHFSTAGSCTCPSSAPCKHNNDDSCVPRVDANGKYVASGGSCADGTTACSGLASHAPTGATLCSHTTCYVKNLHTFVQDWHAMETAGAHHHCVSDLSAGTCECLCGDAATMGGTSKLVHDANGNKQTRIIREEPNDEPTDNFPHFTSTTTTTTTTPSPKAWHDLGAGACVCASGDIYNRDYIGGATSLADAKSTCESTVGCSGITFAPHGYDMIKGDTYGHSGLCGAGPPEYASGDRAQSDWKCLSYV